ncbi:hypothetical protein SLS56_005567 [Neofusicoccum ribis]|uniref:Glutathione S-transferase domain-containing protein n=1 Tax=Neofusicoccum ribis TaxID=45134 RepID=A0ABR3ST50_9PEZI
MTYRLISATPSPYARKVSIALLEKAIPFELITEVPWDSTTQTPRHNPLEKLPVLLAPRPDAAAADDAIFESHHILAYLDLKHPSSPPLLPPDPDARLLAQQIEVVADGVCDACVLLFLERRRPAPSEPWAARQTRKVEGGAAWLARLVEERVRLAGDAGSRDWFLVGGRFGLADVAVGCVCGYLDVRWTELGWRERWPALARWADWVGERESFRATVPVAQRIGEPVV